MKWLKRTALALLAVGLLYVVLGWDHDLKTVTYTVESDKVDAPLRVACLTDLHSCTYGEGQRELLDAVTAAAPDLVVLVGDIYDDVLPPDNTDTTLISLAENWPCYYVTGNHDAQMADEIAALGITVLDGTYQELTVNGQAIRVCGVSDPRTHGKDGFAATLEALNGQNAEREGFSLLLAHRPAYIAEYLPGGYDLILSGHAHGGQWRIPGLLNGLLAPDEGLFPQYAGGRYDMDGATFIVSRGLAKESTRVPRLFNPPELVLVDVT